MSTKKTSIEGIHFQTGQSISISIENGLIQGIESFPNRPTKAQPLIGPGLVDLQINGCYGFDFNTLPLKDGVIQNATKALWAEGVTTYFPTVITNSDKLLEEAMVSIANACSQDKIAAKAIAGIHLEGPFISADDGPRGAHDQAFVKAPDWELFSRWQDASGGKIKIITLSPEWPDAADFISKCVESGVTVSIGHTAATPEQIREAVSAGARMSTHLGNGAHLVLPRHPNYIWEQLAADELWTCVIADGFHLPDAMLKVVFRAKGRQSMLVSDAVYLSGMEPGEYKNHIGGNVVLTPAGRLHLANNEKLLAGSAQLLPWGIDHLIQNGLATLGEAWEMASVRPSILMKLPSKSGIEIGAPADLVIFERSQGKIKILQTYKSGEIVYAKSEL